MQPQPSVICHDSRRGAEFEFRLPAFKQGCSKCLSLTMGERIFNDCNEKMGDEACAGHIRVGLPMRCRGKLPCANAHPIECRGEHLVTPGGSR